MTAVDQRGTGAPSELRVVPVRHPGRWVAVAVVVVLAAMLVHSLFTNPNFQWGAVRDNLFTPLTLRGLLRTLELTVIAMAIGIAGGILLAVMRLSPNPVLSTVSWFYIWFFRGTPVLVQIIFWFYLSALFPRLSLGIPFTHVTFTSASSNTLITQFVAAILALGLNEAAYMSEIVRAGILSVDEGQAEAAAALGMHRPLVMRRIVLPQAMRVIVPPTGNETISMLKTTSLVSAISVVELLRSVQTIYNTTFQTIPLLLVASIWYLFVTSILTVGQFYLERYFGRGSSTQQPNAPLPMRILRALRYTRPQLEAPLGGGGAER